ncbi:MAG: hypothetical protein OEM25_04870, partial [Gammaproteobacteria bacterium]|nr:hypothetical protein [Gammaproteobacteria bacterium]
MSSRLDRPLAGVLPLCMSFFELTQRRWIFDVEKAAASALDERVAIFICIERACFSVAVVAPGRSHYQGLREADTAYS